MKRHFVIFVLLLTVLFQLSAQKKKKETTPAPQPIEERTPVKKGKFKPYNAVITSDFKKDDGLFTVFEKDGKFYFQVSPSLFSKDMLWVTRISDLPEGYGGGFTNAGSKTNEQIVTWDRVGDKILLRSHSFNSVADPELPISKSVDANTFDPILFAFDIETIAPDSSVVFDVTKLFSEEVSALSPINETTRRIHKIKRMDSRRSYIEYVKSFPMNVEVRQVMTWEADAPPSNFRSGTITMRVNQSMVLLPEKKMMPRMADERVGWFTVSQIDYGSEEYKSHEKSYIRRWRLEPKDPEAYARGELVEPVKPIVYYMDPATPEKWRPYIKQGVEDWQKAFESAGFKNAILCKEPPSPEEDPEFSPEDVRYSTVRYVASTTRNAVGPSVSDPRTGEIIESDIIWYHNHLRSYRNRYMIETGAANPAARTLNPDIEVLGDMIRMVIAHEIGHALGLPHNMKASSSYPVDSLRSGAFTQKYGIAASIMDYARFNYIAQPGDQGIRYVRQMGPYDHYAINWGYRYIDNIKKPEDELKVLNGWILEKAGNRMYEFGSGNEGNDPNSQTENVGDDPVRASDFGLKNLKKVLPQLPSWTSNATNDYGDLEEVYGELLGMMTRYAGHVVTNVGGIYETRKTPEQTGVNYIPVSKATQKKSVNWLLDNIFVAQPWLLDQQITGNIGYSGHMEGVSRVLTRTMSNLLSASRLERMVETSADGKGYTPVEMLTDVRKGVFSELTSRKSIGFERREVQRQFIESLGSHLTSERQDVAGSDVPAISRGQLVTLKSELSRGQNLLPDELSRNHVSDLIARIDRLLEAKK